VEDTIIRISPEKAREMVKKIQVNLDEITTTVSAYEKVFTDVAETPNLDGNVIGGIPSVLEDAKEKVNKLTASCQELIDILSGHTVRVEETKL